MCETYLAPNIAGTRAAEAHPILRVLDVPGSLSRTGSAPGALVRDAGDFLFGGEAGGVPVVDVQIGQTVASRRHDVAACQAVTTARYSAMPIAAVTRRMNGWFSVGMYAFAIAASRDTGGWSVVVTLFNDNRFRLMRSGAPTAGR